MKLCKDCKWCVPDIEETGFLWWKEKHVEYRFAKCTHPSAYNANYSTSRAEYLKTGEPQTSFCQIERTSRIEGKCRDEAKYFEAK